MRHYVIVGSGIAGLSAAEAVRASDPRAEITIVGREPHPFYARPALAYLLAGAIPERQLTIRSADELRDLAAERRTDDVARVEPGAHEVMLARGGPLRYDRLLLATGSEPVRPELEGAALDGVVFLDQLDDARTILGRTKSARTAVVIGGGPTAVELAEGLHASGLRVHYLMRGGRYWAGVLDPVESRIVEDALEGHGLSLHRRTEVARIVGAAGKVAGVETTSGERIACELVAIAVGVRPRIELARTPNIRVHRGILVDDRFETSHADVFAAGDVAEWPDPGPAGPRLDALWSSALRDGRAAGRAMAGDTGRFVRPPSLNVTRLAGISITIIGAVGDRGAAVEDADLLSITRGDSESWRATADGWAYEQRRAASRIRVVLGERRLLGAVVMGDLVASRALVRLVRDEIDISDVGALAGRDATSAIERLIALGEPTRA